jgi:hypothetical protein
MTPELIAMLGGSVSGFVMKLVGAQMENQARQFERMIGKQQGADASADAAAKREGGVLVRRFLVVSTVFAIIVAPFVFAWTDVGVSVGRETNGFLGLFKGVKWDTIQGFVILPEIRQTALAIVGFYFGSSQIK